MLMFYLNKIHLLAKSILCGIFSCKTLAYAYNPLFTQSIHSQNNQVQTWEYMMNLINKRWLHSLKELLTCQMKLLQNGTSFEDYKAILDE